MSVSARDNRKSDPLWARGFTRLFDIIIENTARLGLTSHQIRMILVLNLLAFRGQRTTYRKIGELTGTTPDGARKMVKKMAGLGWIRVDNADPKDRISLKPYEERAVALANQVGPRRQKEPENYDVEFVWTAGTLHFTRLPALLFEHPDIALSATELHLILVISYFTYGFATRIRFGQIIHTSIAEIAELMGVRPRSVSRILRRLEARGYLIRTTQPGQALSFDLSPLFDRLRETERALSEVQDIASQYNLEILRELLPQTQFAEVPEEVITSLIKQYGAGRVAMVVDILSLQYRNRRILNPARLLKSMLARGIEPDEGFIPWPIREAQRRQAEQEEARRKQIEALRRELEEYAKNAWRNASPVEREPYICEAQEFIQSTGLNIPLENLAISLYTEAIAFDRLCNERGTPPERREKLRKLLFGGA
ncbi:MAG: MarR family transcriptional regulator [candidate division WOR-3 bacterium]